MISNELTRKQFGAIARGINLGRILQKDHPEIAILFGYYSQTQIPEMLNIQSKYEVSDSVARNGVHHAITGHDGSPKIEAFPVLIDEKERKWIAREHNVLSALKLKREKKGMFGRTPKQISKDSRRAYKAGLGKRTSKQRKKDAKSINPETGERYRVEAGRKGVIAKGFTIWSYKEKKDAYQLSLKPKYQHSKGARKGEPNLKLIKLALNIKHHGGGEVRNKDAVGWKLREYKKSLEAKVGQIN